MNVFTGTTYPYSKSILDSIPESSKNMKDLDNMNHAVRSLFLEVFPYHGVNVDLADPSHENSPNKHSLNLIV